MHTNDYDKTLRSTNSNSAADMKHEDTKSVRSLPSPEFSISANVAQKKSSNSKAGLKDKKRVIGPSKYTDEINSTEFSNGKGRPSKYTDEINSTE